MVAEEEVLYLENSRDMKFLDVGGDFFVLIYNIGIVIVFEAGSHHAILTDRKLTVLSSGSQPS